MNTKTTSQKALAGELRLIPLSKLRPSRRNVRRTRRAASIPELAASIGRVGLLQNLTVTAAADGEHYNVEAGSRRLAALKLMVKKYGYAPDAEIACLVVPPDAARTASLTENVQREAMHPADEFEAFAELVAEGRSVEDIAADFGVTPLVVKRRLKLANVSPRLMDDYRNDAVTLEQLMALAITDDHAAQEAAFYEVPEWERDPSALRARLTEREIEAGRDGLARFVGLEAYEQAGGVVRRDLFADDERGVYLADAALLESLARDRLAGVAERVQGEGWSWVEVAPRATYADLQGFRRAPRERREPTARETKRIAQLQAEIRALDDQIEAESEDTVQEILQGRYEHLDRLNAKLDAIEERLQTYSTKVRAFAGVVVTVDAHGEVAVHRGLLREAEAKALRTLERCGEGEGEGDEVVIASPARRGGISEKLARQLSAHRTAALQIEMARRPQVALAALAYELVREVVLDGLDDYCPGLPIGVRARTKDDLDAYGADLPASDAVRALAALRESWRNRLPDDVEALFDTLLALPQQTLVELLAVCVALTVDVVTPREDDDNADVLARAVGLDMRAWWSPTAESYFAHVPKAATLAAAQAFAPDYGGRLSALKKNELATKAERLAAGTDWLPPMLARQAAWIDAPAVTDAVADAEQSSTADSEPQVLAA